MSDHNGELDNELAAFTDKLLAGEEIALDAHEAELGQVVQQLQRTLSRELPGEDQIHHRIRQRLSQEWDRQYPVKRSRMAQFRTNRVMQRVALAAALVVVFGIIAVWAASQGSDSALQGTASGSDSGADVVVILAIVAACLILIGYIWRRRR